MIWADRGTPNPNATRRLHRRGARRPPNYDPCDAGPGSDLDVFRPTRWTAARAGGPRTLVDDAGGASQWFPWAGYLSDGTLVVAWDEDTAPAPADTFVHVLWRRRRQGGPRRTRSRSTSRLRTGPASTSTAWPTICGPAGYTDPPVADAEGKDCNAFHGDYTGLAVGPDDSIHVTWTGLNRLATSPQIDFYTGALHDGYAQDAMYARR